MSSINKTYSHYPKSERITHVKKIITEELNVLEYAEKAKIAPSSLYRWIKQYKKEIEKPESEPEPEKQEEQEVEKIEEEIIKNLKTVEKPEPEPEPEPEKQEEQEVEKIEEEIIKNLKTVEKPEPEPEPEPEQKKQKTKNRRMDIIMLSMVGISIGLIGILLIQNNKKGREKNDDRNKNGRILERESRIIGIRDL